MKMNKTKKSSVPQSPKSTMPASSLGNNYLFYELILRSLSATIKANILTLLKPKFLVTKRLCPQPKIILDIGIANNSYEEAKLVYPYAIYHGVDILEREPFTAESDLFFRVDLEQEPLEESLSCGYDLIIANHVIEHLSNGREVFAAMCRLLNDNGVLYAEFPSIKTAMGFINRSRYHFHSDPTHKRLYTLEELANIAFDNGCKIQACGKATTPVKNIMSPLRALIKIMIGNFAAADSCLLHASGKINFVAIRKPTVH